MVRTKLMQLLHDGLNDINLHFDRQTESTLIRFIELIEQWNRVFNLTAIRDLPSMISRHLLDSLTVLPYITGDTVLDVGTGAGLPGMPLAIVAPQKHFLLIDSNQKKTRFLQQACHEMNIHNVSVITKRIEDYQPKKLIGTVISRAFSTLQELLSVTRQLLTPGTQILAMKGVYPLTELTSLQKMTRDFALVDTCLLKVPYLDAERHVVNLRYQPASVAVAETA